MDNAADTNQIARITVKARVEFLPAVISFVREVATNLGLAGRDTGRLELVTEEACLNVIEHAFDPGEEGVFDVVILKRPGQLVVGVEDQGLPFDFKKIEAGQESGLGVMLMRAFADEIQFLNLGRQGKRVELVKNLHYKEVGDYISEEERRKAATLTPVGEGVPLTMRLMKPEDSINLARCVYRCYGYTYAVDFVYFPDKVRELLTGGLMVSYIALNPEGEIVGHIALRKERPEAKIGETGQAVVDPRYRGYHIYERLRSMLLDYAREHGMYGTYAEAVTVHAYSQKGSISLGSRETGLLLGFLPTTMFFRTIQKTEEVKRRAVLLLYTKMNQVPLQTVYPPFHHQTIIRRIYERGELNRSVVSATDSVEPMALPSSSQIDMKVLAEIGQAYLNVTQYGTDLVDLVKFRLQELCHRRIDCIFLDLPLNQSAIRNFCAPLEMLGFFFGGIMPELADGDVLRLQYLNNVDVDLEDIHTASDFGREIFEYVTKAMPEKLK